MIVLFTVIDRGVEFVRRRREKTIKTVFAALKDSIDEVPQETA
jgi:hypothetical protein